MLIIFIFLGCLRCRKFGIIGTNCTLKLIVKRIFSGSNSGSNGKSQIIESKLRGYEYFIFNQKEIKENSVSFAVDRSADHFNFSARVDLVDFKRGKGGFF